mmetsp:Transcript_53188/g.88469  ORF Transcript_53188/g.88469 Transcript_53188/m.88469 type:complete len:90 (-) Transcript_53188:1142-1411(-)
MYGSPTECLRGRSEPGQGPIVVGRFWVHALHFVRGAAGWPTVFANSGSDTTHKCTLLQSDGAATDVYVIQASGSVTDGSHTLAYRATTC